VRVLLVGLGNMGQKYLRKLRQMGLQLVLCDEEPSKEQLALNEPFYASVEAVSEPVDCAVVAVDPVHHPAVAKELLKRGVRVLLEKPPAASSRAFLPLVKEEGLTVSEIELYSVPVRSFPPVGVRRIYAERLGAGRGYLNPLWDLAWHDLYVLQHLIGPVTLRSVTKLKDGYLLTGEAGGVPFELKVAWEHPEPKRYWLVEGEKELYLDFAREELYESGRLLAKREEGDKLSEMLTEFLGGKTVPESRERALNNLILLESLDAPRGG